MPFNYSKVIFCTEFQPKISFACIKVDFIMFNMVQLIGFYPEFVHSIFSTVLTLFMKKSITFNQNIDRDYEPVDLSWKLDCASIQSEITSLQLNTKEKQSIIHSMFRTRLKQRQMNIKFNFSLVPTQTTMSPLRRLAYMMKVLKCPSNTYQLLYHSPPLSHCTS